MIWSSVIGNIKPINQDSSQRFIFQTLACDRMVVLETQYKRISHGDSLSK